MAWTEPKTWSSEPLTSTDMNQYVRDNQNYLKDRLDNKETYELNEGSNFATTSTSFVEVDGAGDQLELTITTEGGAVLVGFAGVVYTAAGTNAAVGFDLDIDGSPWAGNDGFMRQNLDTGGNGGSNMSFVALITGLSAGSHTIKLLWKSIDGDNITMPAGAGTSNYDQHPQFWAQEI